jgi:hypothetical protein
VTYFRRVVPASIMKSGHYDVNKYVGMVLVAAETILRAFGFKRKNLGFQPKPKDFLEELRLDREQVIFADLQSLEDER